MNSNISVAIPIEIIGNALPPVIGFGTLVTKNNITNTIVPAIPITANSFPSYSGYSPE
jgi:hypothetical protein